MVVAMWYVDYSSGSGSGPGRRYIITIISLGLFRRLNFDKWGYEFSVSAWKTSFLDRLCTVDNGLD